MVYENKGSDMVMNRVLLIALRSLTGFELSAQESIPNPPDTSCDRPSRQVVVIQGLARSEIYEQSFSHWNVYMNLDSAPAIRRSEWGTPIAETKMRSIGKTSDSIRSSET